MMPAFVWSKTIRILDLVAPGTGLAFWYLYKVRSVKASKWVMFMNVAVHCFSYEALLPVVTSN